jgi:H+/Cl- antiporter ClcA
MNDDDDDPLLNDHNVIEPSNENNQIKSIESLREWFIWSYLNVIIGGVIFGLIAVGCSLRTNKFKERRNYSKANKWSYVTLIVNCIVTLGGLTGFVFLIFIYSQHITMEQKLSTERKTTAILIHPAT